MDDNLFPNPPGAASFVAIGDSFTEGLNDPAPGGGFRGWADRLAGMLAAERPGLRYANLAVRGKLLREIVREQLPAAVSVSPSLVSIAGGGNDILRPGCDPDTLAELMDSAIARLRQAGCQVLMFTGFDPVCFPVLRLLRGRIAAYDMHLRAIADAQRCYLVDLWSMRFLRDPGAWSPDRLHLTAQSHQRVALRACEVLGVPVADDWRAHPHDSRAFAHAVTGPAVPGRAAAGPAVPGRAAAGPAVPGRAAAGPAVPGRAVTGAAVPGRAAAGEWTPAMAPADSAPALAPAEPAQALIGRSLISSRASSRGDRAAWLAARREDLRWARDYALPWVNRRLHRTSSGDSLPPKRPDLQPVTPPITM